MPAIQSFDGINSGLNTTAIIDALMQFQRRPAVLMENEQEQKTSIVSTFTALQAKILALNSEVAALSQRSTWEKASISVSDDTYVTAASAGRVSPGTYELQVSSLARNHQIASQGFADTTSAVFGTGTLTLAVGSSSTTTVKIDSTNNSLEGIKQAINNSKSGVTAAIVNDGSSSNSYRLVLTADKTGAANSISFSASLNGLKTLNLSAATFDSPESKIKNSASSSAISLGATAAFTGSTNKTYKFTVQGAGSQTVGSGNVTVNWTDGTNSGSILVSQADAEVELVGTGSEGLKLSFSAGALTAGDTFQVQTFAPILQSASDAVIAFGSTSGGGSPITVTSETNSFANVLGGLNLTVKKVTQANEPIQITTDIDTEGIRAKLNSFIKAYNDVVKFVDEQNSYDKDKDQGGILLGDLTLQSIGNQLRSGVGSVVSGITGDYRQLNTVGIRTNVNGQLQIRDGSRLDTALRENLDDVISLFVDDGVSSSSAVEFVTATDKSKPGKDYAVNVTQAATKGKFVGSGMADPASNGIVLGSSNNRIRLSVDGKQSDEIVLTAKTYSTSAELVAELQQKINADKQIGNRGITVSWKSTGIDTGYLELENSTYGSSSIVNLVSELTNSAHSVLGLGTGASQQGKDVVGTINGEQAEGVGQILTGKSGNKTTEGLKLKVTMTEAQIFAGGTAKLSLTRGIAARVDQLTDSLTAVGSGLIDRRIKSYNDQVDNLKSRIKEFDARLVLRRERLLTQYQQMEATLGELSAQGSYLTGQLSNIQSNWRTSGGSN